MVTFNSFSLRVNPDLLEKLRVIADVNSRSLNKEIEHLIKQAVSEYEEENGEIKIEINNK